MNFDPDPNITHTPPTTFSWNHTDPDPAGVVDAPKPLESSLAPSIQTLEERIEVQTPPAPDSPQPPLDPMEVAPPTAFEPPTPLVSVSSQSPLLTPKETQPEFVPQGTALASTPKPQVSTSPTFVPKPAATRVAAPSHQGIKIALASGPFVLLLILATTVIMLNKSGNQTDVATATNSDQTTETNNSQAQSEAFIQHPEASEPLADYTPSNPLRGDGSESNPFLVLDPSDPVWQKILPQEIKVVSQDQDTAEVFIIQNANRPTETGQLQVVVSDQPFKAVLPPSVQAPELNATLHWLQPTLGQEQGTDASVTVPVPYHNWANQPTTIYYYVYIPAQINGQNMVFVYGSNDNNNRPREIKPEE